MIKFFRNIRRGLMETQKFKKYMLYAIGEIFLVVIGILIALQINNWREQYLIAQKEFSDLKKLQKEFDNNIKVFTAILEQKKIDLADWESWLLEISSKDFSDLETYRRKSNSSITFIPTVSTYNKIVFTGSIDNIKNDSLRDLLNAWDASMGEYKEDEEFHGKFLRERLYPYEIQIIPSVGPIQDSVYNPFYTAKQNKEFYKEALNDFTYRNILIRQTMWLKITIDEGDNLMSTMKRIKNLLDSEIDSRSQL